MNNIHWIDWLVGLIGFVFLIGFCILSSLGCSVNLVSVNLNIVTEKENLPRMCAVLEDEYREARTWCESENEALTNAARRASCLQMEWWERYCPQVENFEEMNF